MVDIIVNSCCAALSAAYSWVCYLVLCCVSLCYVNIVRAMPCAAAAAELSVFLWTVDCLLSLSLGLT